MGETATGPSAEQLSSTWSRYVGLEKCAGAGRFAAEAQAIVWFDIGTLYGLAWPRLTADNTLYSQSETRIADLMTDRIRAYFCSLGHEPAEAEDLHTHYYKEYGLAIRGLVKHHEIDALDYDAKCDASLPLESILQPNREAIALFEQLNRGKCRVYALTNAYKHRVLRLLGLDRLVEAVVYCDYVNPEFACKPERVFYDAAMAAVQAPQDAPVYFVDDSPKNVHAAQKFGWKSCVLFDEKAVGTPRRSPDGLTTISRLAQLRELWPELFT